MKAAVASGCAESLEIVISRLSWPSSALISRITARGLFPAALEAPNPLPVIRILMSHFGWIFNEVGKCVLASTLRLFPHPDQPILCLTVGRYEF